METFFNLIQEVQKKGLCHRCGGCVTFCTAINYGALELDQDGKPRYRDAEKCIECGLCYLICPEIHELDEEQKRTVAWSAPMGRVLNVSLSRALNPTVRKRATDGGVVTAVLLHLLDRGFIDGAIVTKPSGPFTRTPWLATTHQEILDAAGFHFDTSHGMSLFSTSYSTYVPSIMEMGQPMRRGLRRVAFVGTPCQIKTIRKMEALGVVPSDSIKFHLGLFCTGNFSFGAKESEKLQELGGFQWNDMRKINVKEDLYVHLENGETRTIPLDQLGFMKRFACRYCDDYSSEFADISFGGLGAEEGWTTVLVRTPLGRAVMADARQEVLETLSSPENPHAAREALHKVEEWSERKKRMALENREKLQAKPVFVKS